MQEPQTYDTSVPIPHVEQPVVQAVPEPAPVVDPDTVDLTGRPFFTAFDGDVLFDKSPDGYSLSYGDCTIDWSVGEEFNVMHNGFPVRLVEDLLT